MFELFGADRRRATPGGKNAVADLDHCASDRRRGLDHRASAVREQRPAAGSRHARVCRISGSAAATAATAATRPSGFEVGEAECRQVAAVDPRAGCACGGADRRSRKKRRLKPEVMTGFPVASREVCLVAWSVGSWAGW